MPDDNPDTPFVQTAAAWALRFGAADAAEAHGESLRLLDYDVVRLDDRFAVRLLDGRFVGDMGALYKPRPPRPVRRGPPAHTDEGFVEMPL